MRQKCVVKKEKKCLGYNAGVRQHKKMLHKEIQILANLSLFKIIVNKKTLVLERFLSGYEQV